MFTGLIQEVGKVSLVGTIPEGKSFHIHSPHLLKSISIDDSVAVNGVCLTVTKLTEDGFIAQAVKTTLTKTTLNDLKSGDAINLELALRLDQRLGGHFVQGHVNGIGTVVSIKTLNEFWDMAIRVPESLEKYFVLEGPICLDGVSLTIAAKAGLIVHVSIIPHTLKNTTLHMKKVSHKINLEVDLLAKYVESLLRSKGSL
jgi:riboflavin synthase